ncbi:MAG: hypothetical protein KJ011_05255 [Burkholderiaceae bacterium]|nr:hypothetical protein [Burkholderiaceae bacterium]
MVAEGMLLGIKPDDLKAMAESPNWGRTKLEFQNGIGVDPYDGTPKAIVPNVNAPHMPTLGADGQVGVQPNLPVQNFQMQRARAGATTVAPTFVQEKAESQAVGKFYGEAFGDIQKAGFAAQNRINNINRMAQLLEGIETGRLTPTMKDIAGVAHSLGINIDPALPQKEAIESLSNEMALQARNPSGGAGMPGALSDKDREYLSNIVPGLSKTPGGNRTILETARKLAQRDADVARMAREYRKRNGALNEGFYDELQAFAESNPLFGGEGGAPSLQDAARQELQRRQGR